MIQSGLQNLKGLERATEVTITSNIFHFVLIFLGTTGNTFARCTLYLSDFSITHGGRNDVTTHVNGKHHVEAAVAASNTTSVAALRLVKKLHSSQPSRPGLDTPDFSAEVPVLPD